jgi:hypothetical protein
LRALKLHRSKEDKLSRVPLRVDPDWPPAFFSKEAAAEEISGAEQI